MFIGHYSAAFVAATHPKAPKLGTLFIAAQLVDIGFFSLLPLGIEHMRVAPGISTMNPMDLYDMPWTHSLVGALAWGAGFAILLGLSTRSGVTALIGGAVVVSHWILDLLVHIPDLTIAGAPPKLGLGLWNYPAIEMPLEIGLLLVGAFLFARTTRPTRHPWALPVLLAALFLLQAVNWFGAPPAKVDSSVWGLALFAYLLAAGLAWWVARNRVPR